MYREATEKLVEQFNANTAWRRSVADADFFEQVESVTELIAPGTIIRLGRSQQQYELPSLVNWVVAIERTLEDETDVYSVQLLCSIKNGISRSIVARS